MVFCTNSKQSPCLPQSKILRFICQIALAMRYYSSIDIKKREMEIIPKTLLLGTGSPVPLAIIKVVAYSKALPQRIICLPEPVAGKWYRLHIKEEHEVILDKKVMEWTHIEDNLVVYSYLQCLSHAQVQTFDLLSKWATAGFQHMSSVPPWWIKYQIPQLCAETLQQYFYAQGKTFRVE